ncbi:VCBS repeat-containing protein [Actinoplanes sp. NPDC049548]|uniref:FG-GAP repeat domain-containing protein n=1 Tax=Actinoplanes sp. NPDC049548 TaxID=3155152 RepID=UPI00343E3A24
MAGGRVGRTLILAASLAAGSLVAPASARAAIPYAPCQPDGVSATDQAIAERVRPAMNGPRLGRSVDGYHISCARAIVGNVRARGLNQRAAVIAVTAAIAESTLHNYTVATDHDSLGLFQQRPSQGWGRPGELVDPRFATLAFLNAMIRKHPGNGWLAGDIGQICQRVQGSAFPLAYAPEAHDAQLIVAELWTQKATAEQAPAKKKPTGPFQRQLMAAATGLAATDARHDLSMADWNGDRRPDLVVVQRSGTATGRTELYILDATSTLPNGAASFQHLLLHTGTLLGPTDEHTVFSMADWNGDGRLDLVAVQRAGTASGRTEVRVLDGAAGFQRYLLEAATLLGPTDDRHTFALADWNGDGRLDLVVAQQAGTASRKAEVRVLDGASSFGLQLSEIVTALGVTDARQDLAFADWNGDGRLDLVAVRKSGTASRKTEIRVLNGGSLFQRNVVQARTALGATDDRYDTEVADWNGDGRLDLVAVQKAGAPSGRTEARVFAG